MREAVLLKTIIMIGPTGVGKTEISRRLAKLANAPFVKVEATKFTEVGYVGRDVEQIVRDLMEISISLIRDNKRKSVVSKAELSSEERVLDALVGEQASADTRQKFRKMLREGDLDDKKIEVDVMESQSSNMPSFDIPGMPGASMGMLNLGDILGNQLGAKTEKKKMTVKEALEALASDEAEKLLDEDGIIREAIENTDRKSTRLNSSHDQISYAVFCLKKKKKQK